MDFLELEEILSVPRIGRYKTACKDNEQIAFELYLLNIDIAKDFYALLSLFEVALRNAINNHYKKHFADNDWLINQTREGLFRPDDKKVEKEYRKLTDSNRYSPDKLIAALSFGIWAEMFSSLSFVKGGMTLMKIFPKKQKGFNQKIIQKELKEINYFRNKIAHHEPICLDKAGSISTDYLQKMLREILKYFTFLGVSENLVEKFNKTENNLERLKQLQESLQCDECSTV
jgi:hypothetical protein